jgi:cytochrome c oxidase subunit 3
MISMGEVLPYRPPRAREETTAYLGMVVFLGSWAMMFAALFFAYGFVRTRSVAWPPPDLPKLPWGTPAVNTLVLAGSSAAIQYGVRSIRQGASQKLGRALLLTVLLGSVFLVLQLSLWTRLYAQGLRPETGGPYGSVFWGLTCFHALHVAVGLIGIGLLCARAFAGTFSAARYLPVRLWTLYWHFVGAVWALMFVLIFLL